MTNSVRWWVKDSCARFLPTLLPVVEELQIISARSSYERSYPDDPGAWKREAFKEVVRQRPGATNLVVLGDSMGEIRAARGAHASMPRPSLVKTVKFREFPTSEQIQGQLCRALCELDDVVGCGDHVSAELRVSRQHGDPAKAPGRRHGDPAKAAESWSLAREPDVGLKLDNADAFRPSFDDKSAGGAAAGGHSIAGA